MTTTFTILSCIYLALFVIGLTLLMTQNRGEASISRWIIAGLSLTQKTRRTLGIFLLIASAMMAAFTLPGTRLGKSWQGSYAFSRFLETSSLEDAMNAFHHWREADDAAAFDDAFARLPQGSQAWKEYIRSSTHFHFNRKEPQKYITYLMTLEEKTDDPMGLASINFELGTIYQQFDPQQARDHFLKVVSLAKDEEMRFRARGNLHEINRLNIGQPPPAFSLQTTTEKTITPQDLKGKVTLLDFWSIHCHSCLAKLEEKKHLYSTMDTTKFTMISISLENDEDTRSMISNGNMPWLHVLLDPRKPPEVLDAFNIQYVPNTYLLDAGGHIAAKGIFGTELEETIKRLINNK